MTIIVVIYNLYTILHHHYNIKKKHFFIHNLYNRTQFQPYPLVTHFITYNIMHRT